MLLVISRSHPDAQQSLFDGNELVVPSIHIAIFATAMAMMCIVRQPVYAGIFSIAILYLSIVLVWVGLQAVRLAGWLEQAPQSVLDLSEGQVAAGFIGCFVFCTLAGWLALRNDWGLKRGY
jgi:hypothetical protein